MQPDDQLDTKAHGNGHSVVAEEHVVGTTFRPNTGRKVKISAGILAAALLLGFLLVHFLKSLDSNALAKTSQTAAALKPRVDVVTVSAAGATHPLALPGETAAWYESTIYSRVNGYVAKWFADIGDHVQKGQTLALIDTTELDSDLTAARAELTAAEAQVKVRESEAEFAKSTNERWRDSPKGVVSEQERAAKKADYDSAVAKLNAARAQVALDQARVDRFTTFARFKQVAAPYDGTITERRFDIGNLVTAGSTAGNTLLYRVSQDNPISVWLDVPQSAAGELMKAGGTVEVRASNLPDRIFSGAIARTARSLNPQARTLRVEVDIPNADRALVPGMYVTVSFHLASDNLLQVPAAALVFRASGPHVAVVDDNGRVSFRKVAIARDDGNAVELSSGISPGDKVALNVSSQIGDGELVAVDPSAAAPPAAALRTR